MKDLQKQWECKDDACRNIRFNPQQQQHTALKER